MAIGALRKVAQNQNGLGAFILQCKRLDFHYCDWAGSSRGMVAFIKNTLPRFARANPQIEFHISPRPRKHPIVRAHYINGRAKAICVRNLQRDQILRKSELLRDDATGRKLRRVNKPVQSVNESVRGIWSPFHQQDRWKIV